MNNQDENYEKMRRITERDRGKLFDEVRRRIIFRKLVIGLVIGLVSVVLAGIMYDWSLGFIIFLALWGNNISRDPVDDQDVKRVVNKSFGKIYEDEN
jgi:hypothetical protein